MTKNIKKIIDCVEIEPKIPAQHAVIFLHGLGADGHDFVPAIAELGLPSSLGVRFIFPHAPIMPVTINSGYQMRAWYDITSPAIHQEIDHIRMHQSMDAIKAIIERENERGISNANIVLAGFSQGAVMALLTGLTYAKQLGGVIALSGYLPIKEEVLKTAEHINTLPIFLAHGTEDTIVSYALGKAAYVYLQQLGCKVDWHSYPIAHSVSAQELADIRNWIMKLWHS